MNKRHIFPIFVILISVSSETQESNLVVLDSKTKEEIKSYLIKNTEDTLELTCKLKNITEDNISLSWVLPFTIQNGTIMSGDDDDEESYNGTSLFMVHNEIDESGSVRITISSLRVSHSGSYQCVWVSNTTRILHQIVTLIVKPRKVSCGKKFDCGDNQCISPIYKCDGVVDCRSKIDEAIDLCGSDPCQGRVICTSNGRCIPSEWCKVCDPLKANCTHRHRHDCCPPLGLFPKGLPPYSDRRYNDFPDSPNMQHQYDITIIHTTVYTIIGCALIFMLIVTILVIAICRVQLKRAQPAHILNNRRVFATTAYHRAFTQEIGVYDMDIAMNRCDGPGLLVTYNINNGVQIVGNPVDPPPYSEVATLPPREGPPPPYALSVPGNEESTRATRSVHCGTSPKPRDRPLRRGLTSHSRVSSEPSLANLNRL